MKGSWSVAAGEQLPLPPLGWGARDALDALEQARRAWEWLPPDTELISALTTVVFRCGPWAVKVFPPGTSIAHVRAVAASVADSCVCVHLRAQPVETDAGVVVVSSWIDNVGEASWEQLGALLGFFHREPHAHQPPPWSPLSRLRSQLHGLQPRHQDRLLAAAERALERLADLDSVLGWGRIHGDVAPNNTVVTASGTFLIDLDWVAYGPREYDLASAARRRAAGVIGEETYDRFVTAYGGFDVRDWPGLALIEELTHLSGLVFRLWDDRQHRRALTWLDAELAQLVC